MELLSQTVQAGGTAYFPQGKSFLLASVSNPVTVKVYGESNKVLGEASGVQEGLRFAQPGGFVRIAVHSDTAQTIYVLIAQETVLEYNRLKGDVSVDNWPASQTVDFDGPQLVEFPSAQMVSISGTPSVNANVSQTGFNRNNYSVVRNAFHDQALAGRHYVGNSHYNPIPGKYATMQLANGAAGYDIIILHMSVSDTTNNNAEISFFYHNGTGALSGLSNQSSKVQGPTGSNPISGIYLYEGQYSLYSSHVMIFEHSCKARDHSEIVPLRNCRIPYGGSIIGQRVEGNDRPLNFNFSFVAVPT